MGNMNWRKLYNMHIIHGFDLELNQTGSVRSRTHYSFVAYSNFSVCLVTVNNDYNQLCVAYKHVYVNNV
jgi:hypothetical protein